MTKTNKQLIAHIRQARRQILLLKAEIYDNMKILSAKCSHRTILLCERAGFPTQALCTTCGRCIVCKKTPEVFDVFTKTKLRKFFESTTPSHFHNLKDKFKTDAYPTETEIALAIGSIIS